jgi:hypothetical protein
MNFATNFLPALFYMKLIQKINNKIIIKNIILLKFRFLIFSHLIKSINKDSQNYKYYFLSINELKNFLNNFKPN